MRTLIKGKKSIIIFVFIVLVLLVAIVCLLVKIKTTQNENESKNKKEYDSVLDKWKAGEGEKCSDEDISQLVRDLLVAADNNDVEAIEFIKQNNSMEAFKNIYGEPNGYNRFTDNWYYEIENENGSARFLELGVSKDGYICDIFVVKTTTKVCYQLLMGENGEIYIEKEFG